MATLLLDGQRVVPARPLEHKHAFHYPRLRGALEHLTHPAPASARNAMQARHA